VSRPPHLLAVISDHGFGHLAIVAPLLEAAHRRLGARLSVQSGLERAVLAARIDAPFEHHRRRCDLGMLMDSAIDVRVAATAAAYADYHRDFPARVADEARWMGGLAPDLVLASVPYLTLAAASRLGVPAVSVCSLNWAGLYRHYCGGLPGAADVHAQILDAYRAGTVFLRPAPSMPMPELPAARAIGPIARPGRHRRAELIANLRLQPGERVLVAALGGIATTLPVAAWPRATGLRYVVPAEYRGAHPDAIDYGVTGLPFMDLLCSADAVLAKPGYGTFAEAACHDIGLLYVRRGDWPEEPYLTAWLHAHARAVEIDRAALARGDFRAAVDALGAMPGPPALAPDGIGEGLAVMQELLGRARPALSP